MSNALTYRHFDVEQDLLPLVTLLTAVEQEDLDGEIVSEEALREQLNWPDQDLRRDRWVVVRDESGELVGYAAIFKTRDDPHADIYIAVHPAWRRRGIGGELLARARTRAHELRAEDLRAYAVKKHQGVTNFLLKHQFRPVSGYTRLQVSTDQPFPIPTLPPGFTIRSYDQVQRIELFLEAINRSYDGLWGHRHIDLDLATLLLQEQKPAGIFLLFAPDESIVGICRATMSEALSRERGRPTGHIDAPGIVAEYRAMIGLYQQILLIAIRWLLPQSPVAIELESWGDESVTLDAYRALGFMTLREEISYQG